MTKEKPTTQQIIHRGRAGHNAGRGSPPDSEALAAQALGFLAKEPRHLADFLALTGLNPATLRESAGQPGFARGVLSHMMADERLLVAFATHLGLSPAAIDRDFRAALGSDDAD